MTEKERLAFFEAIVRIAHRTRSADWASDDGDGSLNAEEMAKPIPPNRWHRAFKLGMDLDDSVQNLPMPVPGADPSGHCWLTWERGLYRFSLGLTSAAFVWDKWTPEAKTKGESATLGDMADVLKSTFPYQLVTLL